MAEDQAEVMAEVLVLVRPRTSASDLPVLGLGPIILVDRKLIVWAPTRLDSSRLIWYPRLLTGLPLVDCLDMLTDES